MDSALTNFFYYHLRITVSCMRVHGEIRLALCPRLNGNTNERWQVLDVYFRFAEKDSPISCKRNSHGIFPNSLWLGTRKDAERQVNVAQALSALVKWLCPDHKNRENHDKNRHKRPHVYADTEYGSALRGALFCYSTG